MKAKPDERSWAVERMLTKVDCWVLWMETHTEIGKRFWFDSTSNMKLLSTANYAFMSLDKTPCSQLSHDHSSCFTSFTFLFHALIIFGLGIWGTAQNQASTPEFDFINESMGERQWGPRTSSVCEAIIIWPSRHWGVHEEISIHSVRFGKLPHLNCTSPFISEGEDDSVLIAIQIRWLEGHYT